MRMSASPPPLSIVRRGWDVLTATLAVLFVRRSALTEGVVWAPQIHHHHFARDRRRAPLRSARLSILQGSLYDADLMRRSPLFQIERRAASKACQGVCFAGYENHHAIFRALFTFPFHFRLSPRLCAFTGSTVVGEWERPCWALRWHHPRLPAFSAPSTRGWPGFTLHWHYRLLDYPRRSQNRIRAELGSLGPRSPPGICHLLEGTLSWHLNLCFVPSSGGETQTSAFYECRRRLRSLWWLVLRCLCCSPLHRV